MKAIQFLIVLALFVMFNACEENIHVDTIVHHARVYTVNDVFDTATAFAIRGGKFVAIANDEYILENYTARETIDAKGRVIVPGFNDGHSHFLGYGLSITTQVLLTGTKSFDEVVQRARVHHDQYPSAWLLGRGWDQNDWADQRFPDRRKLDEVFPETPVALRRIDGHALIANGEAIRQAGITADTYVEGGEIIRENGRLTGIFIDNAMSLITNKIPEANEEQMIKALQKAQENCFAAGLTSVTDAGLSKSNILLIDSLQKEELLDIRIYAMMSPSTENFDHFFPDGPYYTDKLTVSSVKLYVDGALGSRGALLLRPYADDPDNVGLQLHPDYYYDEICSKAYDAGFQVNTHAIGDSGNRLMLNTYAKYLVGKNDRRWRVEHAQVVNPDDLHFFGDYSIIPSVQSTHCTSDMYWADERLGTERIKHAYAYKDLLDQNGWLINGTDFPVEDISPLKTFYSAVARKDESGWPEGGFQTENSLTREEALRSMTIWPAAGSFNESITGSIEAGKVADFVILDKNILEIPEQEILSTKVVATYLDGKEVYKTEEAE